MREQDEVRLYEKFEEKTFMHNYFYGCKQPCYIGGKC